MTDDSKFAIVSPKSVKLYAEIVGAQNLTDDLASSLAEDVTYRLRETLQVSLVRFTVYKRGHVTRILLFWVNSVLNSLVSAFTHTQNTPLKL